MLRKLKQSEEYFNSLSVSLIPSCNNDSIKQTIGILRKGFDIKGIDNNT
jgi:hypothetical protein